MTVGRNEPCPCGSGKKYKNCCFGKKRDTGFLLLISALVLVGAVSIAAAYMNRDRARSTPSRGPQQTAAPRPSTPQPQPPGAVPPGKVWSAEHGHWHDAVPGNQPTKENPITVNRRNIPQPPGPVPDGKVWSPDHGHWHTRTR